MNIITCLFTLAILLGGGPLETQATLEQRIEEIFFVNDDAGENYDRRGKILELGHPEEVKAILLSMVERYKHAKGGTREVRLLTGATVTLGDLSERRALAPLSSILLDRKVDITVRGCAARSLGQIDPDGTKQTLLTALKNKANMFFIRLEAAKALVKTNDPQVLQVLEQASRTEKDAYVRQQLDKSAQELRRRIQRPQ